MTKVAILQFPGTNCDFDTEYACSKLGCKTQIIWHKEEKIPEDTHLVVIAGGFSYGDYLRSGAIAKFLSNYESCYRSLLKMVVLCLGYVMGFQILTEARLLPGCS